MINEDILIKVFNRLNDKIINEDFVIDKTGTKTVELICEKIELDPYQPILDFNGIRKTPAKYVEKELEWYISQDLSIINHVDDVKIWNEVCTKDEKKEVNSNYGWMIFSKENHSQFDFALNELIKNKYSRRACMIYNRPSMTKDYNRNGMSDYCCTFSTQQLIRNDELIYVVIVRSNDIWSGFFSDFPFHCYVYDLLYKKLSDFYDLKGGKITWIANSLHAYERNFEMIKNICDSYKTF